MTVDRFKPERWYPKLILKWSNLYYACSICNSHYKKDYPTPEEEAKGIRFLDPCEEDLDEHFRLVRDRETGDPCRVRPLSPAAEYVVFRLKLNLRKSPRDFWRCLHHKELYLLRRQNEIHRGLEVCSQLVRRHGPSHDVKELQTGYESLLTASQKELDTVRLLRPFPVE
jgi:hypothetical protein